MISWIWLIPAVFVGVFVGVMIIALCAAGRTYDNEGKN